MSVKRTAEDVAESVARADADVEEVFSPHRDEFPVRALAFIGELGDQPQLRLISAGCIAAGLLGSNPRLARAGTRMLLAHELATLAKNFVKDNVDRTRPRTARNMRDRQPRRGSNPAKEESSFPSGHTAGALAVARAFSREYPEHGASALLAAGTVAAAQVPRCAHYVSDISAGVVVGLLSEAAADALWRFKAERHEDQEPIRSSP